MALLESMVVSTQVDDVLVHLIGGDRLRLIEAVQVTAAKNLIDYHQLIAVHLGIFRIAVRIDVD